MRRLAVSLTLYAVLGAAALAAPTEHLVEGSVIPAAVAVEDAQGGDVSLLSLFAAQPGNVNVLFIFGGGDLGKGLPGQLWCPDSFEDTHILRTLHGKYRNKGVGFVAVASAPVYHGRALGAKDRVFLDAANDSDDFKAARQNFIDSTLAAHKNGILPIAPHFDTRFALMLNPSDKLRPGPGYGNIKDWYGAFRAADETQFYGVPSYWLVDDQGKVLVAPFRGNVYHPHGGDLRIRYTFSDVDRAVQRVLGVD
jgi:hypothetical protein